MSFVASSSLKVNKVFNILETIIAKLGKKERGLAKSKKDGTETFYVIRKPVWY